VELENELENVFASVFPKQPNPRSVSRNDGDWDSFKHIELITVVEERFGLELPIEVVMDVTSFESLLAFLRKIE
jgi:acyl carrier protein